jgi:hypothetical protein
MNCTNPFISARHAAGAPDFSGPGFSEARRIILIAPDMPDTPPDTPPDTGHAEANEHHEMLLKIADELDAASEKHSGQANRIRELCDKMMASKKAPPDSTDGATGEAMELG